MQELSRWVFLVLFVGFMAGILYLAFHHALPLPYVIGVSTIGAVTVFVMATVKKGELHD